MKNVFNVFSKCVVVAFCFAVLFLGCKVHTEPVKPAATYTVTFNANDGSETPAIFTQTFTENVVQNLTSSSEMNISKTEYQFTGWATTQDASNAEYSDGQPFTAAQNITLYAVWKANQYSITFNPDNGSAPIVITQAFGSAMTAPENPLKTGYSFSSWDKAIPETMPAENLTITAQWTVNQYSITFNLDNGSEPVVITQDYGTTVMPPDNPTKEGYTFTGWSSSVPQTMPAQNVTITALYTINQYTITFMFQNGSEPLVLTQNYGSPITPPEDPEREGCIFTGWDKPVPQTMPANDLLLTACFTPLMNVTLNFLSGTDVTVSITEDEDELWFSAEVSSGNVYDYSINWYLNGIGFGGGVECGIRKADYTSGYYELIVVCDNLADKTYVSSYQVIIQ